MGEASTEEALAEFNFLGSNDGLDRQQGDNADWGKDWVSITISCFIAVLNSALYGIYIYKLSYISQVYATAMRVIQN